MPARLLLVVNVILIGAAALLGTEVYRAWHASVLPRRETPPLLPPGAEPGLPARQADPSPAPLTAFTPVAERNLFSPTRTEAPAEPAKPATSTTAAKPAPAPAPRPRLYGVVLGGQNGGRAYLEDPRTRRVFAYAIGDPVAESRLERIEADRVILRRGTEIFEVLLRDPSKPRPASPPPAARPGVGPTPAAAGVPAGTGGETPATAGTPAAPGTDPAAEPPAAVRGQRPPIRVPAPPVQPPRPPGGTESGEGSGS